MERHEIDALSADELFDEIDGRRWQRACGWARVEEWLWQQTEGAAVPAIP